VFIRVPQKGSSYTFQLILLFPLKYHSFKKACPGEVRGRNPEGVFFSDPWLRGTGKRVESRIKARNRGWKPLPQAVSSPGSRFRVQRL
jgi:hypothetical protein